MEDLEIYKGEEIPSSEMLHLREYLGFIAYIRGVR